MVTQERLNVSLAGQGTLLVLSKTKGKISQVLKKRIVVRALNETYEFHINGGVVRE